MSFSERIQSSGLVNRAKNILLRPKEEWRTIDTEQTDIATVYRSYVAPLAAIGPVASLIGGAIIGTSLPLTGVVVRVPIATAVVGAVIQFALALAGVYVVAKIADTLAPNYGGTSSMTQAFKVAAYSSTAQWLAGVFAILPGLRGLSIVGIYSAYLLYLGLPVLMKVPEAKALTYTAAVIVVSIVVFVVIAVVSGLIIGSSYLY